MFRAMDSSVLPHFPTHVSFYLLCWNSFPPLQWKILRLHWIKFFVSIAELQFSSRNTKTRYSILWKITVDRIANTIERCRKFKTFRAHSVKLFFEHSTVNVMWGSSLIRFLPENRVERFCSLFLCQSNARALITRCILKYKMKMRTH